MAQTIDDVVTAVNDESTVIDSGITLLTQLHDMLVAAQNNPAKIQAVIDAINAKKVALANAIVANTPEAPPPPPPPPPQ